MKSVDTACGCRLWIPPVDDVHESTPNRGLPMKKRVRIAVLLTIITVAASSYYFYNSSRSHQDAPTLTLYGNVDIRDVPLAFQATGQITNMLFEEGDDVRKGDTVAELDKRAFEGETNLYQAEFDRSVIALANVEKSYARQARLVKSNTIPQSQYDDARSARDSARASVRAASARVNLSKIKLDYATLTAPNDGTILTRVREVGSVVPPGATIYTLALHDPVWIRAYVNEPNLGHIFPGQNATITTDSGDSYRGQIGFISPQAEFTPKSVETTQLRTDLVYRLRIIVDNPNRGLRQGMPVTVTIRKRSADTHEADTFE